MSFCSNCGKPVPGGDANFCSNCGAKIESENQSADKTVTRCPRCGFDGYDGTKEYCQHCGYSRPEEEPLTRKREDFSLSAKTVWVLLGLIPMVIFAFIHRSLQVSGFLCALYFLLAAAMFIADSNSDFTSRTGKLAQTWFSIAAGVLFLLSVLNVSLPTNFEKGETAFEHRDWNQALEYLSRIHKGDSHYTEAHRDYLSAYNQRQLDSAKTFYAEHNWTSVIMALSHTTQIPEVAALVDSAQYQIDSTALAALLRRIKPLVSQKGSQLDSILDILTSRVTYSRIISTLQPNGPEISATMHRIADLKAQYDILVDSIYTHNQVIADDDTALAQMREEGVSVKRFAISSAFPGADGSTTDYDAMDLNSYSRVVIADQANRVSSSIYDRINEPLLVRYDGMESYSLTNAYGISTSVNLPTYETTYDFQSPYTYRVGIARSRKLVQNFVAEQRIINQKIMQERSVLVSELSPLLETIDK